jgi:hypothetical protein
MRKLNPTSLFFIQLGALLGAVHCSAPADSDEVSDFTGSLPQTPGAGAPNASPGAAPSGTGAQSDPATPGVPSGSAEGGPAPAFAGNTPGAAPAAGAPGVADPALAAPAAVTPPAAAPLPAPPAGTFVERGNWHGFAFSEAVVPGTTLNPATFDARQPGQPFCLSGSVAADPMSQGQAAIGFNINQAAVSDVPGQAAAPLTATPTGTGIALSFTRKVGSVLRIQLQAPGADLPWCYEVPEVTGTAFAPYSAFNTHCWDGSGEAYTGQPFESVRVQVPGDALEATPYDFCVNGFADGRSVADAPTDILNQAVPVTGSLSAAFERSKVLAASGESYVVQNNAWGTNSRDGSQVLQYSGNSFQIMSQTAQGDGSNVQSFPSIFIGANGAQGPTGGFTTALDDNLPIRVSDIGSVQTRLRHNGGNGDYNVTYDVWFATNPPTGEYSTAQAAFLMVWLYKPNNRTAIGCDNNSPNVTVDGRTWRLCVGSRSEGSDGGGGNAPVISYLHEGAAIPDYAFDLNVFIQDAATRSQNGQLGATFSQNLFLTDVFGGFEIWSGGAGLRVDEFSALVR